MGGHAGSDSDTSPPVMDLTPHCKTPCTCHKEEDPHGTRHGHRFTALTGILIG